MVRRLWLSISIVFAFQVFGDSWFLPERATFDSSDGQWRLSITPKDLREEFDRDSANVARAELYRKSAHGTFVRTAAWRLVNEVSPVDALVANDGTAVTFDHWGSVGYGEDVVVIYRPDGALVRQLALEDLLETEDILQLPHSTSSIWWAGKHRLDETERSVVLEIKGHQIETIPLSLETGEMLVPKRSIFPKPRVAWQAEDVEFACRGGIALTAHDLAAQALEAPLPEYPVIARKARIAGSVVLHLVISSEGVVEHAEVAKPLPFGATEAARETVRQWRFLPMEREGKPAPRCARVRVLFELPPPAMK